MKRIRFGLNIIIEDTLDNICSEISTINEKSIWFGYRGLSLLEENEWERIGTAITSNNKINHIELYPFN